MLKVMMAAPFKVKGRYQGGIHAIANSMMKAQEAIASADMQIIPFNTCRIERQNQEGGGISIENLQNFYLIYRDVLKELRASDPDVFYMHSSVGFALLKDVLILRKVKKRTGCKTVLHIHFADIDKILTGIPVLDKWLNRMLRNYVDRIVFLSKQTMEQFVNWGVCRDKCHVIYNFSALNYRPEELFDREETQEMNFLFVGSIDKRKGLFDVLRVMQELDEPFTLHVCGGFENAELEAQFRVYQEKMGNKLQFHGFVKGNEKREIFKNCDVLLLPSYGEGLPVVILEAFSAGCGVVTTNVGAIPEIVGPQNGSIISPGDMEMLHKALQAYLHMDKADLRKQKQENFALAEQYRLDTFIRKIAATCEEACK